MTNPELQVITIITEMLLQKFAGDPRKAKALVDSDGIFFNKVSWGKSMTCLCGVDKIEGGAQVSNYCHQILERKI